jgi:hypothetical protein
LGWNFPERVAIPTYGCSILPSGASGKWNTRSECYN